MNPLIGGALALLALVAGGLTYGWRGVIMAMTVIVFWLLLQFSRLMRVMRLASEGPIGHVHSAVMFHSQIRAGMKMVDLLPLARSLGDKLQANPETYAWHDVGGARVEVVMENGRVDRWKLFRAEGAVTGEGELTEH